jgi:LysM repeat protein
VFIPTEHKIKKGDTLSEIAQMYNTNVEYLANLNNIKDINKIKAGNTLKLFDFKEGSPTPMTGRPFGESLFSFTDKESSLRKKIEESPGVGLSALSDPDDPTKLNPKLLEFFSGLNPFADKKPTTIEEKSKQKETVKPSITEEESFLPINIRQIFSPGQDRTEKDLSKEERDTLKKVIARSQTPERIAEKEASGLNPYAIEYKDYETTEKGAQYADVGGDMGLLGLFNKLQNPAYNLKTFLGQASAIPQEGGGYRIQDIYDFKPSTKAQGLTKFGEYLSSIGEAGFNPYSQVRNFMGYYGPQEGTGMGGRSDIRIMKQGGDTMDIQQQTKNVAAQGRYGDSMLLHVNPAEVKGLASAMPITVNPQTGQPEAFLPFLAPLLGSMGFSALAGTGLLGTTIGGLSAGALSGIGAGLAQTAVTGDIKEGLKAGLTAGLSTRILTGAGNTQIGQDALTTPTTSLPTDPTTGLNYSPTGALESAMTQNIATTNPALANPLQAGPTVTGTSIPQTLNPLGQANLNTFMSSPAADNYLQPFADDAIANFGAKAGNPTALESLGASFTDSTGGYDIGQGFSNIGTAAMDDPLALAGLGTTGTMYGMDMMQADYEEQMARMQAEREEKRRQNMLMNPEPTLYAGGGAIRGFNGEDDSYTGGDLPQIFAPARAAYDVNPNFMAGFNPETMYFNPATISAPASGLEAGGPPVVLDTYTGTKGGYGGDPLVISPEGRQASIDPFSAYTGEAPAGLVPYSTTLPSLDITGTDLGLPMGEGTPAPAGVVFDDEIVTLDEQEGENNFTDPNVIDPNNIGGGVYIPNIGNINIPAIMSGMGNFDIPESFVPMGGQDFGITQPIIDYQLANTFDLIPEEEIPVVTRKGGGDTLKPIPEGNKGLPNLPVGVRKEMGYMQAGGMTDMQNDPLTQEVTAFLLGESNNEEALNMFLTKYGNEAFMQLREAVLQSVVPGAQTQGQIKGNGEGGMDDDLRGMIGDKERIAVSQDEFIVPADVVSMLGDGSSDAGSKELYDMMDRVRKEKTGTTKQAPRLANAGGLLPA